VDRQLAGETASIPIEDLEIGLIEVGASQRVVIAGIALDAQFRILEIDPALDPSLPVL
jgi:hypothetical protein